MDFSQILTLSIVQGITEFLPISSSAHLILVPMFTAWQDQGLLFDIGVHVGTLLAVILYFKNEFKMMLQGLFMLMRGHAHTVESKLAAMLVLSTLPLVLIGPFAKDFVEVFARSLSVIAFTSIFYGVLLYMADKRAEKIKSLEEMNMKQAALFGLFQALAIVPGTSRSGICMTAGRLLGFSRKESARYAMLMSIPIIFLIGGYGTLEYALEPSVSNVSVQDMLLGLIVSFSLAYVSIHLLIKFVEKIGFLPFVLYRIALGFLLTFIIL